MESRKAISGPDAPEVSDSAPRDINEELIDANGRLVLHIEELEDKLSVLASETKRANDELAAELADAFVDAVRLRTRGPSRVGVLLSGGLDSRAVLAADKESRIGVALTVGDTVNQEVRLARRISAATHHRHVFVDVLYCR